MTVAKIACSRIHLGSFSSRTRYGLLALRRGQREPDRDHDAGDHRR
jgi:hypothetical protein